MKKIVVANNKGGVGKTTVASQIIYSLSERGHSVLGVDLDSQRNLTTTFEDAQIVGEALDLVSSGRAIEARVAAGEIGLVVGDRDLQAQNDDAVMVNVQSGLSASSGADFCVIDTPPNFSDLVYGALLGADYLLVPIELKKYSVDGIEGVLEAFFQVKEHNDGLELLGVLPSRYDAVKQIERDALASVIDAFPPELIIPHPIGNRSAYVMAQEEGVPLSGVKTKSGKDAQAEFGAFFDWFYERVGGEV